MSESQPWLRLYTEFAIDPIVQSLAFEDQRHLVVIWCLKRRGDLDRPGLTKTARERIIRRTLGLSEDAADEAKRRLMEVGLITANWQPPTWSARQFLSDVSTERARKSRARKTQNSDKPLNHNDSGNNNATVMQRSNVVAATPSETEAEAYTDLKSDPLRDRVGDAQKGTPTNGATAPDSDNEKHKANATEAKRVLSYLNYRTSSSFLHTKPNGQPTNARTLVNKLQRAGYTYQDFQDVIDLKADAWENDDKMREYLRPDTLFRPSKFETYLHQSFNKEKS